ncbi:MAG: diguanylate cyclase domain-containing protein [Bacillota bacterium]
MSIDIEKISKEYLDNILKSLPEIIIILDEMGNYLDILTANSNDLIDEKENLIGKNVRDILPAVEAEKFIELCQSSYYDEEVKNFEYDLVINGERLYFEALFSAIDHQDKIGRVIVTSIRNITRLRQTEQKLQEQQAYFKQLFNNSTEAICLLDNNHCVIQVNQRFEELFGYSEEEINGKNLDDFILPEELEDTGRSYTKQVKSGDKVTDETVRKSKDGSRIDVFMQGFPVNLTNGQIGIYGLYTDISERKKKEKEIEYLSFHDEMTGLYNRRYFENELKRLESSRRRPIAIVIGDVDGLKSINDNYGHKAGDKIIKSAAQVLREVSRSEDVVARMGGDEFAVILPETDIEAAQKYCQRIRAEIARFNRQNNLPYKLSISIGTSTYDKNSKSLENVFNQADTQMYIHKSRK